MFSDELCAMPAKVHIIGLSAEERHELEKVSGSNHRRVREKTRARILLLSDIHTPQEAGGSCKDEEIATRLRVSMITVGNVRKRACERGVMVSIKRQEQKRRKARALDGRAEAHLIALTCSAPPEGCARWTIALLREGIIAAGVVDTVAQSTVFTTLKKTNSNRG